MDIGRLKKVAQDIISDDEWVNDYACKYADKQEKDE